MMQVYGPTSAVHAFPRGIPPFNQHSRQDGPTTFRSSSTAMRSRSASNAYDMSSRPPIVRDHYKSNSLDPRAAQRLRSAEPTTSQKQHMQRPSYYTSGSFAYTGRDGRPVQQSDPYGNRETSRHAAPTTSSQRQSANTSQRAIYQNAPPTRPAPVPASFQRAPAHSAPVVPGYPPPRVPSRADDAPVVPPYPYPGGIPESRPRVDSYGRPHWNARDGVRPRESEREDNGNAPLIHNALGWWPDQRKPLLIWDLSSRRSSARYTKRDFDAQELKASPFTPPLSRMKLILSTECGWSFDITARPGERYITLQGLLESIISLMHTPGCVPHAYWTRASANRKEEILRTMLKRTGRRMPVVPPHRRPKTRGQLMEEAVLDDAQPGYTNLQVVDLLGDRMMFWGMEFVKEPNEWLLKTAPRWN